MRNWDQLLLNTPGASFFHSSAWCRVLSESYGYKPVYFAEIAGDRFRILVPMMEIDSFLTGKRGVSLPFTDYCDPIIGEGSRSRVQGSRSKDISAKDSEFYILDSGFKESDSEFTGGDSEFCILDSEFTSGVQSSGFWILTSDFKSFFSDIISFGKKRGWRTIELRSRNELPEGIPASARYYGHTIDLSQGEKKLFANLRDSTRRNIKKAVSAGVTLEQKTDLNAVREFYRLNCLTRRDHGLPPQPWSFFRKVHEHVLAKGLGTVVTAFHHGRAVASSVFFSSAIKQFTSTALRTRSFSN